MADLKLLTESDLRSLIKIDLVSVDYVEKGFKSLALNEVVMPPILSMMIPDFNGEVDVKTAYVPGIDSFAIKMSPGYFDNPKIGLPSTSGLMVLFSAKTGVLEALLLDNGYLTDLRTAAAGAVAARHLSRKDASHACIVGAGMQARLQLEALLLVRPIKSAVIWARNNEKAQAVAADLSIKLGINVTATESLEMAVLSADLIVTTTPSTSPLVMAEWLRPGQHLTAMGSDQDHKNEIDPACFLRADLYVADRQSQTAKLGELRSALAVGIVQSSEKFYELVEISSGNVTGRETGEQITLCDLTGTRVQDTAIANLAYRRALEDDAGTSLPN